MLNMNVSTLLRPQFTLASQLSPPDVVPRIPVTADASYTSPPNCGVKPPGMPWAEPANGWWNVKQFGSAVIWPKAAGSGALSMTGTTGQLADPLPSRPTRRPRGATERPSAPVGLRLGRLRRKRQRHGDQASSCLARRDWGSSWPSHRRRIRGDEEWGEALILGRPHRECSGSGSRAAGDLLAGVVGVSVPLYFVVE